jgi:hypothetical protein
MTLLAVNGSDDIVLAETASGSITDTFGNLVTIVQRVSLPEEYTSLEHLKSVLLYISNTSSATSGDLYLVVYNATGHVVGIDIQEYETDVESYTFTFGRTLPLSQDTYYDLMLAAPFTENDYDYEVAIIPNVGFTCASVSCGAAEWEISEASGSDDLSVLIDFFLDKKYVGEGFLRALTASFSMLGKEHFAIDTDINVTNITIEESGPWEIEVNASFVLSTHKVTVSFSDIAAFGAGEVSVIGLYDPYSMLMNYGEFPITEQNVSDEFDEEDFYRHLSEHTFVFNEGAPSFLNRFTGEDAEGSSCCGIQSILLYDDISNAGYSSDDERGYSYIDYMFHTSAECSTDATSPNYLYYISYSGSTYDFTSILGSDYPILDYSSAEFYHLDEMSELNVAQSTCPNEGGS